VTRSPIKKKSSFVDNLILENKEWAESIAKAVACAWKLDAEVDGIISAAVEALVECAHRYEENRGIPFRAYARTRVHQASCDAARQTRSWREGQVFSGSIEAKARSTALELLKRFPELHQGALPFTEEIGNIKSSIRQLLLGATIIYLREQQELEEKFDFTDYSKLLQALASLENIHQWLIWKVYWEGSSLRGLAEEWGVDPLGVIREHQVIVSYLSSLFNRKVAIKIKSPKVRPSLKKKLSGKKQFQQYSPFQQFLKNLNY
jgi:DNA-directed RNA polymerase specialized sigma subunit